MTAQSIALDINRLARDTTINDTAAYIQSEFVNKKEKYLNKALSVLLYDLKLPVRSYTSSIAHNNRYIAPGTSLSFLDDNETSYRTVVSQNKPAILWIKWATPLPKDSVSAILQKSKKPGEWGEMEKQYYGKQIVKDFGLVNWSR